jgi:hypothetical protein
MPAKNDICKWKKKCKQRDEGGVWWNQHSIK